VTRPIQISAYRRRRLILTVKTFLTGISQFFLLTHMAWMEKTMMGEDANRIESLIT